MSRPRFPASNPSDILSRPGATNHAAAEKLPQRVAGVERAVTGMINESLLTTTGDIVSRNAGGTIVRESRALSTSTLPSSPYNGQVAYYQTTAMAAQGVVWTFRYNSSAGTYKWQYIGGSVMQSGVVAGGAVSVTSYGATGATVALPLAGIYDMVGDFSLASGAGQAIYVVPSATNMVAATDAMAALSNDASAYAPGTKRRIAECTVAGSTAAVYARVTAGTGQLLNIALYVSPLAVA